MKKALLTAVCAVAGTGAFGQGQLLMSNSNPIFDNLGNPLGSATSNDFSVELLAGSSPSTLVPVPSSINYVNQGFFYGPGATGVITISGAAPGTTIDYAVEAWNTAAGSYANAQQGTFDRWGESAVNSYTLGGGSPPVVPSPLNFGSFIVTFALIPEPATFELGLMSSGSLLLLRRPR